MDGKERKRKIIMEAALKIFSQKGYSPAVLDEVAREAGVAKGTLYLYFKDKGDLFYSTIMFVFDKLEAYLKRNVDETQNPLLLLNRLAYYQLDFFSKNREAFSIYFTILNESLLTDFKRLFQDMMRRRSDLIQYVLKIVSSGKGDGIFRKDLSTEEITNCYVGLVDSLFHQLAYNEFYDDHPDFNIEEKVNCTMQILLEGVGVRPTESEDER
jgi:TetR/AcrR family fatty acid metabolism transcriptional regulator